MCFEYCFPVKSWNSASRCILFKCCFSGLASLLGQQQELQKLVQVLPIPGLVLEGQDRSWGGTNRYLESHWSFSQNTKLCRIWDVVLHGFSPTGTRLNLALYKILNERTSPLPLPKSFDFYSVSEKKALSSAWLMQGRLRINLG